MTTAIQHQRQRLNPKAPSDALQQTAAHNIHNVDFDAPGVNPQQDILANVRRQSDQDEVLSGTDAPLEEGYGGNPVRSRQDQTAFEQDPQVQEDRQHRNTSDARKT